MGKFKRIKGKTTWVVLKLDMEMAYGRLEWDYIQKCLQQYGFHPRSLKWIMECITTVSHSLMVTGESTGLIKPTRGVDPIIV